jgi:hypothetical protein
MGGENCGDPGDYPDRAMLVDRSTIECYLYSRFARLDRFARGEATPTN